MFPNRAIQVIASLDTYACFWNKCAQKIILKWTLFLCVLLQLTISATHAESAALRADIYLFWSAGCPHCEREIGFLEALEKDNPGVVVHAYEITHSRSNLELFKEVVKAFGVQDPAVPMTIIGNQVWVGYVDDSLTGAEIRNRVKTCLQSACPNTVTEIIGEDYKDIFPDKESQVSRSPLPETIQLPLLGEVRLRDLSLPVLSIILGALDGFNPCAMWTLLFLIGLLVGIKDTMRMWVLGSAFIIGSAAVYFMFMTAWLNLLFFLGSLLLTRLVIGLVALGGSFYYLREYFQNKEEACPVTVSEERQRVFHRLKLLAQERNFLIALCGILALAFLVNLVELVCSAGIPAVYTQILAMHTLPTWQYYSYLLLYILVFMADDLLVFVSAMLTLRVSGLTTHYSRYSHLFGGLVLLVIGAVMLLRPELLMFG